ncbi:hypothetical protein N9L68_05040 [bacterium]|nr:hypothetical protein [bacterium]
MSWKITSAASTLASLASPTKQAPSERRSQPTLLQQAPTPVRPYNKGPLHQPSLRHHTRIPGLGKRGNRPFSKHPLRSRNGG